ncbi:DUF87 domain-containing protein [Candidatus Woesebacteria bacterium]|nr:DUF87 domain-containing protein [Candidatus Woesebacteria bacterium]
MTTEAPLTTLFLKVPRNIEISPESAKTFLATLTGIGNVTMLKRLQGHRPQVLSLELVSANQQIRFSITTNTELVPFVEAQLQSNYPLVVIEKAPDVLGKVTSPLFVVDLTLRKGPYYPIATYSTFSEIDPMSSILSILSKTEATETAIVQIALESTKGTWQSSGAKFAEMGSRKDDGSYSPRGDAAIIKEKILFPGFAASVRIASTNKVTLSALSSAFGVFTRSDGNAFGKLKKSIFDFGNPVLDLMQRRVRNGTILNIQEIATLWHLPGEKIKTTSIVWGYAVLSDPPDSLPVATDKTDLEKKDINFFAKTMFRNREQVFGLKTVDRFRHIWVVGKTGTGKSTLIANMVIDDIKKGRGVGVIDPHGELCETVLNYIPSNRINDTVYFNPADREYPMIINPLEVANKEEAELVVSGIVSVFNKIFGFSWGPRLEYILRNTLLSLAAIPDTTLANVISALTNQAYRNWMIDQMKASGTTDQVLVNFWENEFNKMQDKQREEAISPILNKVGQFVTSPLIRRIIGQPKSSIKIDDVMNGEKIMLANLSQGKLGEDNAALIGAMLITKFQLAAMRRVEIPEPERKNFFLYVDEFQNFATPSFMKILSEARKYRLSLMLANQYMAQIPEEVQKSILGNAGSLISFTVGADDAGIIHKEFAGVFAENDLVNLANRQVATRLMVDGHATRPFLAHTLPLPESHNEQKEKVLQVSRERWTKKLEKAEDATAPLPDLSAYEASIKANPKPQGQWGNKPFRPQGGQDRPNFNNGSGPRPFTPPAPRGAYFPPKPNGPKPPMAPVAPVVQQTPPVSSAPAPMPVPHADEARPNQ